MLAPWRRQGAAQGEKGGGAAPHCFSISGQWWCEGRGGEEGANNTLAGPSLAGEHAARQPAAAPWL